MKIRIEYELRENKKCIGKYIYVAEEKQVLDKY